MALVLVLRSILIFVVSILQFVSGDAIDFPLGISLGHHYLSSMYYNANNELIHVATIDSSQEWQDYFWATWTDPKEHAPVYDLDTLAMFIRIIKDIQSATESVLNHSTEYRSLTAPAHFVKQPSMGTLMLAAYNSHFFASDQSYQVIPLPNAARLAYDLDTCKGLEQPQGCDVDDEDYFALVFEYSQYYLHLTDPNSKTFLDLAIAIQNFMDEMIAYLLESNIETPESKVHGIILAGEASIQGMDELKPVIEKALPRYKNRFLFDIDPGLVGVIGAAHRARQYVTEHGILNPREGMAHEEL
ncbi:hypothetical protein EG329_002259 [Mollisiaceae sp. DMI_Dod_QoI]|nr:hypothetical protein EG329_002259 [Helotiales sp. DMI_Dod_QoI]